MGLIKLTKTRLSNGLRLFYGQTNESVGFELAVHIDTGSRDETLKNNGVSHLLEHMMFRGSASYPNSVALARALEIAGGESNAMTSIENTAYWIRGSTKRIENAMDVFADFFFQPTFPDLELERGVVLQELASDYNEDDQNIDTESLAMGTMFENHPLGLPIIGTTPVVSNLSVKDLEEKRRDFYTPGRSVLVVTANLPLEALYKKLDAIFGRPWSHASAETATRVVAPESLLQHGGNSEDLLKLQENADNQYSVKLLLPAFGGNSRDVVLQNMLQRLLDDGMSARLPAAMREKYGLVYDISCDATNYSDIGTFSVDITVSAEKLSSLLEKFGEELQHLLAHPPEAAELDRVRFRYAFDLEQLAENPARLIAREVSDAFLSTGLSVAEELDIVSSASGAEILEMARKLFAAKRRTFVLVGPKVNKRREQVEKFMSSLRS